MECRRNLHGTALVLRDRGVLITGDSGSGKSRLALALMSWASRHGFFCRLVADDQLFAENRSGRLVLRAPPAISGLIEVRGHGPAVIARQGGCVVDLLARLVADGSAPRLADRETATVEGCRIDALTLPSGDGEGAAAAVAAFLRLPPFGG